MERLEWAEDMVVLNYPESSTQGPIPFNIKLEPTLLLDRKLVKRIRNPHA